MGLYFTYWLSGRRRRKESTKTEDPRRREHVDEQIEIDALSA